MGRCCAGIGLIGVLGWGLVAPGAASAARRTAVADEVVVTQDNTRITRSCTVVIPPGLVIADADGDGVIHIERSGIRVRFAPGSVLRGAPEGRPWDELKGVGIRIDGRTDVELVDAVVHGFKVGVYASDAHRLVVRSADLSDNFRQRLKSRPWAEDAGDWLWPHANDDGEWIGRYGAALAIERSNEVDVSRVRVRRGQNGIVLSEVDRSRIYDNDCSFLSGWGLAMWRSSGNVVSRNAFDFCVRGHVEGVYNRGQDSAGILCFEQCSRNVFSENSATHGGDGFFGFAGKEAIGEVPPRKGEIEYGAAGCNENVLIGNDFSYASAHGIEMTFSRGNLFVSNRVVGNAICGVWGGYSRDSVIWDNLFAENGGMAYGLERGGVNIEHGSGNTIVRNRFANNRCGVHLWWDNDAKLLELPGVKAGYVGVSGNRIIGNDFRIDAGHPLMEREIGTERGPVVLQIRGPAEHVRDNCFADNEVAIAVEGAVVFRTDAGVGPREECDDFGFAVPGVAALGVTEPVGARWELRGRENIIMGEWGPWDHESPMVRLVARGGEHVYELLGLAGATQFDFSATGAELAGPDGDNRVTIRPAAAGGVGSYRLTIRAGDFEETVSGTVIGGRWRVVVFPWTAATDPREDVEAWRALAAGPEAVEVETGAIDFAFGGRGPGAVWKADADRLPWRDRFGVIARTTLDLPAGKWRFRTLSDDGVRVRVGGDTLLENWTWHGPTRDEGVYEASGGPVEVEVEYFEIDGHAVLRLELEAVE